MRSKLFHAIVICGVALGGGVACSDDDDQGDGDDKGTGGEHNCAPDVAPTGGTAGAAAGLPSSGTAGAGATAGSGAPVGCGGWPPTK